MQFRHGNVQAEQGRRVLQGECDTCDDCYICAGHGKKVQNHRHQGEADRCVGALPPRRGGDRGRLGFGNPLTFNDQLANEYGKYRFPRQEGYFAGNANGNGIFAEKTYFRSQLQARTAVSEVPNLQLAVGTEQVRWEQPRREAAAASSGPPPPLDRPKRGAMPTPVASRPSPPNAPALAAGSRLPFAAFSIFAAMFKNLRDLARAPRRAPDGPFWSPPSS